MVVEERALFITVCVIYDSVVPLIVLCWLIWFCVLCFVVGVCWLVVCECGLGFG